MDKVLEYALSELKALRRTASTLTFITGGSLLACYILNRKVKDLYKEIQKLKEKE